LLPFSARNNLALVHFPSRWILKRRKKWPIKVGAAS
jgi:hypothetical protein